MATKPLQIPLTPVAASSSVLGFGYDAANRTFAVRFKNGATYHYSGVDADTAHAISTAKSIGKEVAARLVAAKVPATRLKEAK
jgi:hypothetical protein